MGEFSGIFYRSNTYCWSIVKKLNRLYDDKPGEELLGLMDDIPVLGTVKGVFDNVVDHSKKLSSIQSEISRNKVNILANYLTYLV